LPPRIQMTRCIILAVIAGTIVTNAIADIPKVDVHKSIVRITTTSQDPDYHVPWNPGSISTGIGAGFVIEGNRILTNAHVVSNARFISVQRENDPRQYSGEVQFVAHDCDLAIVKVSDTAFFKAMLPLHLGPLPTIQSGVDVYGYPIGGERLSVTQGIVSRIDFESYSHSSADSHLAVQIDAAINPGNSGGPVLQNGRVVGIAFQGYSGDVAQNVGFMIPTPVIQRFLADIADGHYHRYVDLSITPESLTNSAARRALGLPDDDTGVLVSSVESDGSCGGKLEPGDVLLSIDGHRIISDQTVELDGENVDLAEIVERKLKGDKVKIDLLRNHQPMTVEIELEPNNPYLIQSNIFDEDPRFVMFGGLVFQPLSKNLMDAYQIDDLRVRYYYNNFVNDEIFEQHPEVIILSNILPDPVNAYLAGFRYQIVDEINGQKIRTLSDAAEAFKKTADFYVIKFIGANRPAVLQRTAVEEARQRIIDNYGVRVDQDLGEQTLK
jgi:S1-C subfamily serine protease